MRCTPKHHPRLLTRAFAATPVVLSLAFSGCGDDPSSSVNAGPYAFELRAPGAEFVLVEGTFNQWAPFDPDWLLLPSEADSTLFVLESEDLPERFTFHYAVIANGRYGTVEDPYGTNSADIRLDPFQTVVDRGFQPPRELATPIDPTRLIIYELLVPDFSAAGTFKELIQALDDSGHDLAGLGINAVELLPVHPTPSDFSWGYDCGSHWSVKPSYGGLDGLRDFVDACHARDIAVILDIVLNHSGGHHPIAELEFLTGQPRFFDPDASNPFGLPEFDWNVEVIDYFIGALSHFVENVGIDGFRYDYIEGEPLDAWAQVVQPLKLLYPHTFHIAESFDPSGAALAPDIGFDAQWGGQSSNYGGGVNNYHQRLNCNLAQSGYVRRYGDVVGSWGFETSPIAATADVTSFHQDRGPWRDIKYLESHDERRVVEQVNQSGSSAARAIGGVQKSKLGAISLFTSVGIPMLYHGQEIGVANPIGPNPAPSLIDWSNPAPGLRDHYRNLIRLRLTEPGLASDAIEFIWTADTFPSSPNELDRTLQYWRGNGSDALLIALNFDDEDHPLTLRFPAAGSWARFDPATGSSDETLDVPADGVVVDVLIPASDGLIYLAS